MRHLVNMQRLTTTEDEVDYLQEPIDWKAIASLPST
jgi:hypothetical protein